MKTDNQSGNWRGALANHRAFRVPEGTTRALDRLRAAQARASELDEALLTVAERYAGKILEEHEAELEATAAEEIELEGLCAPELHERLRANAAAEAAANQRALRAHDIVRCRRLASGEDVSGLAPPAIQTHASEDQARVWRRVEELALSAASHLDGAEALLFQMQGVVAEGLVLDIEAALRPLATVLAVVPQLNFETRPVTVGNVAISIEVADVE